MRSDKAFFCRCRVTAAVFLLPCCLFWGAALTTGAQEIGQADIAPVTLYADAPFSVVVEKAKDGVDSAQLELGLRYVIGYEGVRNVPAGVYWIEKAAKRGMPQAEHELASLYLLGVGVPQRDTQAVEWFRKAAIQGYAPSQTALGFAYENGAGVPRNPDKAAFWFDKAAAQGNGIALESVQDDL